MRRLCLVAALAFATLAMPAQADKVRSAIDLCLDRSLDFKALNAGLSDLGYRDASDRDLWLMAETNTLVTVFNFFSDKLPDQKQITENRRMLEGVPEIDFVRVAAASDDHVLLIRKNPGAPDAHDYQCIFGFRQEPENIADALFPANSAPRTDKKDFYTMIATMERDGGNTEFRLIAELDTAKLDAALPDRPGVVSIVMTAVKLGEGQK